MKVACFLSLLTKKSRQRLPPDSFFVFILCRYHLSKKKPRKELQLKTHVLVLLVLEIICRIVAFGIRKKKKSCKVSVVSHSSPTDITVQLAQQWSPRILLLEQSRVVWRCWSLAASLLFGSNDGAQPHRPRSTRLKVVEARRSKRGPKKPNSPSFNEAT